jgi:hypothetical protein
MAEIKKTGPPPVRDAKTGSRYTALVTAALEARDEWVNMPLPEGTAGSAAYTGISHHLMRRLNVKVVTRDGVIYMMVPTDVGEDQ